jgi:methylated-DNA-[protein]-cysteine S-methyltransferase
MKTMKMQLKACACKTMPSPVGLLKLLASDRALVAILWEKDEPKRVKLGPLVEDPHHPLLREAERQLDDYFAGKRETFSLPCAAAGTAFQKAVWQALAEIPFGETRTYGAIARQLGRPNAVRAVGAATGRNPIAIVVPCHRVIGSDGKLVGFAGGLEAKDALLRLETGKLRLRGE